MDALHQESLKFNHASDLNCSDKKKPRLRQIIWFNPPFRETVKTKVAEKFLSLIDKQLEKYFNRY